MPDKMTQLKEQARTLGRKMAKETLFLATKQAVAKMRAGARKEFASSISGADLRKIVALVIQTGKLEREQIEAREFANDW